ncbi:MAG: tRNA pseudouridine(38-40) synthase TruA, partial [Williamsia herbipolensis]|nr:tRNA pseudouridine(38-40) synthase TruA [Williamsia herbipolensis]
MRLRLDIAYDGTDFSGWAAQPDRRTVAGELDTALVTVLRSPVPMVVAGRTDAGVHASGQVAHIDVDPVALDRLAPRRSADGNADPSGCDGLRRRLAGLLPPDVRVRAVRVAPDGFDARFGALRRHYEYRIALTDWGVDPLHRVGVLALGRPLDTGRMARAATALLGLHDFAAFCRPRTDVTGRPASTVRELQRLDVLSGDDLVTLRVSADAFCHSMVRALVGMLVRVGLGQEDVAAPAQLLAGRARTSRVSTAPARGLTLVGVDYPADEDLAERVRTTRALRDPLPPDGAPEFP